MSQVSPDAIERLLSRRGYRLTAPRRNLLEVMASLGDHFSADAVVGAAPEVGFYAYEKVGGSNLDLPPTVFDRNGAEHDLEGDVLPTLGGKIVIDQDATSVLPLLQLNQK